MVIRVPANASTSSISSSSWPSNPQFLASEFASRNTSAVTAIDFRETSPRESTREMYIPIPGSSQIGGLAIGVPGELLGLRTAWEMYGSLPWEDLFHGPKELAKGFKVSRELARRFRIFGGFMVGKKEWENVYRPRGEMLVEGDWVERRNLSDTLEWLGKEGIDGFYGRAVASKSQSVEKNKGRDPNWIANTMIQTIQQQGGVMTLDDLKGYKVKVYDAIKSSYQGNIVYTTDAPSCGEWSVYVSRK